MSRQPSPASSPVRTSGKLSSKWRNVLALEASRDEEVIAMRKNESHKIRVGIIGANPDRGWAMQAHIPVLKSLSDDFEITALSTSRRESAAAAGKLFGVAVAFDNHHGLVNSAAVDVVAITVTVP